MMEVHERVLAGGLWWQFSFHGGCYYWRSPAGMINRRPEHTDFGLFRAVEDSDTIAPIHDHRGRVLSLPTLEQAALHLIALTGKTAAAIAAESEAKRRTHALWLLDYALEELGDAAAEAALPRLAALCLKAGLTVTVGPAPAPQETPGHG